MLLTSIQTITNLFTDFVSEWSPSGLYWDSTWILVGFHSDSTWTPLGLTWTPSSPIGVRWEWWGSVKYSHIRIHIFLLSLPKSLSATPCQCFLCRRSFFGLFCFCLLGYNFRVAHHPHHNCRGDNDYAQVRSRGGRCFEPEGTSAMVWRIIWLTDSFADWPVSSKEAIAQE